VARCSGDSSVKMPVFNATCDSMVSAAEKAQDVPQPPWDFTAVTTEGLYSRQSKSSGSSKEDATFDIAATCLSTAAGSAWRLRLLYPRRCTSSVGNQSVMSLRPATHVASSLPFCLSISETRCSNTAFRLRYSSGL